MKFWSDLFFNLKRARLRRQFHVHELELRHRFCVLLKQRTDAKTTDWHSIQWLTDPILHISDDHEEPHHALVGVAATSVPRIETAEPSKAQLQGGTAIFFYQNGAWDTAGQLLLNFTPSEALETLAKRTATLR